MASMIVLTGRFGSDPNFSQGERSNRASFRFASSEWEQGEEHTDWYSISCFGKLADRIANQGQKGKKATLWGRLRIRKYTTKEGEERVDPSVTASHIEWTEPKEQAAKYGDADYKSSAPKGYGQPAGDAPPF